MPLGCVSFGGSALVVVLRICLCPAGGKRAPSRYLPGCSMTRTDGRSPMSGYALEPAGNQVAEVRKAVAGTGAGGAGAGAAGPEGAGLDLAALEREAEVRGREAQRLLLQARLDARTAREEGLGGGAGAEGGGRARG